MNRRKFIAVGGAVGALLVIACEDPSGPEFPLVITTEALPPTTIGEPYSEAIHVTGGEGGYVWQVIAGALPEGLVLAPADLAADGAIVAGTPTELGGGTFTVEVRSEDGQRDTREFTIDVRRQLVRNVALPPALVGAPYSVPLRATPIGGEPTWEIVGGALPPGLVLAGDRIEGPATATDTTVVTLQVTSGDQTARRTFEVRAVADQPTTYDITPLYVADVTSGIQAHLDAAIDLWERAIAGDLEAVSLADVEPGFCGGFSQEAAGTVADDIMILINIDSIDGPGQVLGQAGPCLIRNSNTLPILGILTLDSGDLLPLVGTETLTDIIAHEIGHVLGLGSLWDFFGITENAGTDSTRYTGAQAVAEFQALGGSGPVPLEDDGGQGTADSHWEESVFGTELMTGFVSRPGTANPLSRVTIAALADLGYSVDFSAADPFALPQSLRVDGSPSRAAAHIGRDVLLDEPVRVIDDGPRSRPAFR